MQRDAFFKRTPSDQRQYTLTQNDDVKATDPLNPMVGIETVTSVVGMQEAIHNEGRV